MRELTAMGSNPVLLNLAEFPMCLALSLEFDKDFAQFEVRRRLGGELDFSGVHAIWWRRPQAFRLPSKMDPAHERFVWSESSTAFQGLYQSLNAFWINPPWRDAVAQHKPYQLALAQRIGLEIAPTLMTNDVERAKSFWRKHEGRVIYKQFIALPDSWRETRRLGRHEETLADSIGLAPVIFQRHIDAVAEVRVTAVGETLFAAATNAQDGEYPQDIRLNLNASYFKHELPSETSRLLRNLMKELGLVYGAIDLRLTPEGKYVFLEINPAGQFLYIEKATSQPIAATIASTLLEHCPSLSC
jgi:glutathione synthase/RimK-type ligase-like ATP-grasp enzyme